jgi:cyclopropane-fatty-acyl-phospholipid synthase
MTSQILPKAKSLSRFFTQSPSVDRFCRQLLFSKLAHLKFGVIHIVDPDSIYSFGDTRSELKVNIHVNNLNFYSRSVLGGSIGNGESYIDQDWEVDNLTNFIRIFVLNREIVQGIDNGAGKLLLPFQKIMHELNANTLKGSKKNIQAHYDIGNDFFKLFLDPTMMYSCALFESKEMTLEEASIHKLDTICKKLALSPEDHIVEIGTGWGGFAIYAAKNYKCKVTTTTISQEQYNYTKNLIKENQLEDKITLLLEDYRNLTGKFDKLVSIEMIEAVGLDNLPIYFEKCSSLIKEDGVMLIQAITIRDHFYESAKKSVDFIQRHVFPGSGIPSLSAIMEAVKIKTDLCLINQSDYAEDYAETLSHWSKRLEKNKDQITKLDYPDYLYRLWQYYFSYCEGGFRERATGLSQLVLSKPRFKNRSLL